MEVYYALAIDTTVNVYVTMALLLRDWFILIKCVFLALFGFDVFIVISVKIQRFWDSTMNPESRPEGCRFYVSVLLLWIWGAEELGAGQSWALL